MKKIFVTGGDGFIGSHLVECLIEQGHEVTALAQYNSFGSFGWLDHISSSSAKNLKLVLGDVRDENFIRVVTKGMDAVIHLAALIGIPYSYIAPSSYVETNISGTLNILQAALDNDCSQVLCTSTSEVYGTAQTVPINEKHPLVGQSPYSATKIAADQLAISFHKSFGLPVTIIRPFNTYGPRQSERAVIPTIIRQIMGKKSHLDLGVTQTTRDFNYVSDTVSGFLAALDKELAGGEVINICSNFEVSIEQTAKMIAQIMGSNIEFNLDKKRIRPEASEVCRLFGDNTVAKKRLDWQPKHAEFDGFQKGLEKTVDWFVNNEHHYAGKCQEHII